MFSESFGALIDEFVAYLQFLASAIPAAIQAFLAALGLS